jgi:hypothetical protein
MALIYPEKQDRLHGLAKFKVVNGKGKVIGPTITLPLPANLTFTDGAAYENAELGMFSNMFAPDNQSEEGQAAMQATADNLTKEKGIRITTDILSKVTGNRTRAALGKTPNPNTRALFKQVNLRTFQVNYKMIPTSMSEAMNIKQIVKAFRTELYPESTGETDGDLEIAYLFPNRFQIRFYLGNSEGRFEVEPRLLDAYLTNMTTSYNSTSQAVFSEAGSNMNFSETDISMTFLESKTLFARDVRGNNN